MTNTDRCSNNDIQCHLAMNRCESEGYKLELKELELNLEAFKERLKQERKPILDPLVICLLLLGIALILKAIFGGC